MVAPHKFGTYCIVSRIITYDFVKPWLTQIVVEDEAAAIAETQRLKNELEYDPRSIDVSWNRLYV